MLAFGHAIAILGMTQGHHCPPGADALWRAERTLDRLPKAISEGSILLRPTGPWALRGVVSAGTKGSYLERRRALPALENLGPEGSEACQSGYQRAVTPGRWSWLPAAQAGEFWEG